MGARTSKLLDEAARGALAALIDARRRRSPEGGAVVLMYHEVAPEAGDPARELVPPLGLDVFRGQLEHLRRRCEVVSIGDLLDRAGRRAKGGRLPVALTFDDDLASHATLAAPLLTELGLPAAFFLTGASLERPAAFWWHDLNELFRRGGDAWRRVLAECEGRWGPSGGEIGLHALAGTIEMLPPAERDSFARFLREAVDGPPRDPGLREADVRRLAAAGFDIGFHTTAHYRLQTLADSELYAAMQDGRGRLAAAAGRPLNAIAYPHGHADLRVAAAAAGAGFELGLVWRERAVSAASHPLLLERIDAWQPSAGAFAFRLARVAAAG